MSNFAKKLDSSDFWYDCLNDPPISHHNNKSSKTIFSNPLLIYTKNAKRNKKIYKYNTKPSYQSSKLIDSILKSEENPKKINKKIQESLDYINSLYIRGMASKEKKNKLIIEKEESNITYYKKESNSYMKRYKNKIIQKRIKKHFGKSTIYERGVKFQQKKIEKIAKLFEENNKKNNIQYSFHPDISFKNLNHVFFSDNYCKEQTDNDSNKFFLSRLIKAREQNETKKNYFENSTKKSIYKFDYKKRLKKSLSQKDSMLFRKELHKSLLDMKCLPTNESNTNNENVEDYFMS